jgi:chromosome partitioning protein
MIIAVLGEKGGPGKTTFATNLAGMRAVAGHDVLLVDADRQGSASYWVEKRDETERPTVHCVQKFGNALARTVRDMARRYDDVIIDVGAGDTREMESALRVVSHAIVPIQPAGLDVWTLGLLDDRVDEARAANEFLAAVVVLNRVSTNPRDRDEEEAREAITACEHLTLSHVVVHDRVAIKRAAPQGLIANEYKPYDAKADQEMTALYALTFGDK